MGTRLQRGILCLGLLLIAGSGLFAPWNYTFQAKGISQVVKPAPRGWLFSPPSPEKVGRRSPINLLDIQPRPRDPGVRDPFADLRGVEPDPNPSDHRNGVVLAVQRLIAEWIAIGAATGAALVILHTRRRE